MKLNTNVIFSERELANEQKLRESAPVMLLDDPTTNSMQMPSTSVNQQVYQQSQSTSSELLQNDSQLPELNHPTKIPSLTEISQQSSPSFFERYTFTSDEPIGFGNNAICMRCRINDTNIDLAVKILRSSPYVDVEIDALSACTSRPNIVEVVDVVKDDHFIFIVTELLDGELLHTYIERNRPLDECSSRKIFIQIARALNHIHSKQIVHRNLEPKNIKLSSDGNVKIFGFSSAAKMILDRQNFFSLTQKTPRKLTVSLFNAPPETLTNKVFKKEADVWFLGVILFKLLFGYHPYNTTTSDTIDEVRNRIITCDIQVDYNRQPPVSPSAIDLIKRLLMPDHKQRIQSNEVVKYSWCSPGQNESIIGFSFEGGAILRLEELSLIQKTELINKLTASVDSTNQIVSKDDAPEVIITSPSEKNKPKPNKKDKINPTAVNPIFVCDTCLKRFKTKRILDQHKKNHLGLKFLCEEENCGKIFSQCGKLSFHIKHTHKRQITTSEKEGTEFHEDDSAKPFTCEICMKIYSTVPILKRHQKSKHSKNSTTYECYVCKRTYTCFERLKKHLKSKHTNKVVYPGASVQKIMPV